MNREQEKDSKARAYAVELSYERLYTKAVNNGDGSVMHNGASIDHLGIRQQFNTGANAARHTYTTEKRKSPKPVRVRWDKVQTREVEDVCTLEFYISRDNKRGKVETDGVELFEGSFNRASDYWCEMVSKF